MLLLLLLLLLLLYTFTFDYGKEEFIHYQEMITLLYVLH